jgi:hypothetical protein
MSRIRAANGDLCKNSVELEPVVQWRWRNAFRLAINSKSIKHLRIYPARRWILRFPTHRS